MGIRYYFRPPWYRLPSWCFRVESGIIMGLRWPLSVIFPDAKVAATIKPLKERNDP